MNKQIYEEKYPCQVWIDTRDKYLTIQDRITLAELGFDKAKEANPYNDDRYGSPEINTPEHMAKIIDSIFEMDCVSFVTEGYSAEEFEDE